MFRVLYITSFLVTLVASWVGAVNLSSKLPAWVSQEPIINFTFPFFEEDGSPKWTLKGHEGRYKEDNTFHVVDMTLNSFQVEDHADDFIVLESPKAIIEVESEFAYGNEGIKVTSSQFVLTGQHWSWNSQADKMTVNENVKVEFTQPLADLVKD